MPSPTPPNPATPATPATPDLLDGLLADLAAEGDELDALVTDADRTLPTPAPGWTIGHQIGHLAWTDSVATLAATDAEAFRARVTELAASAEAEHAVDDAAAQWAARPDLIDAWRDGRAALRSALAAVEPGTSLPWFGPPMSAASMATARLMETWAHGQDVADALGVTRTPTARLRHVAHIGVRTRGFAHAMRGETAPTDPVRVELTAPSGEPWTWGPEDATERVTGPALDFCLLVTQRRHRDDLALTATGPGADHWLDIAQAFAGLPGAGRAPGQFG